MFLLALATAACSSPKTATGVIDGHPETPKGFGWNGRSFFPVEIPGQDRPIQVARTRLTAERDVRIGGRRVKAGEDVFGIYRKGDPERRWLVPPAAAIDVIGPVAWVRQNPDDPSLSRVDLRSGARVDTPVTSLHFFADCYPLPYGLGSGGGMYLARTLGMEEGQMAMIDEAGEIIRLIRDIDAVRTPVEHDHATMQAKRKANPFASFHHIVRPDLERGGTTETWRDLVDQPVQPLRGGGLVVRHRTPELGVFWSVYAADGSITVPATQDLVSLFAPVMDDTSAARNHTRYFAFLVPLPEHDDLYWPILDDGTLLEAEGVIGIRPLNGMRSRRETIRNWDDGFAEPWFATASLWDIGGERVWGLHDAMTNSPDLADAVDAARWTRWERIRVAGVDHLLLEDADGQFRLFGDATVHASAAEARDHIARTVAEQKRKQEEERRLIAEAAERARQNAAARRESERWMQTFGRQMEIDQTIARIEKDGAKSSGDVAFYRHHVRDRARVQRVVDRWHNSQPRYVPTPAAPRWGSTSFSSSYGGTAYQRDSAQFRAWVQQRELWNQRFDQRWGFDRRR